MGFSEKVTSYYVWEGSSPFLNHFLRIRKQQICDILEYIHRGWRCEKCKATTENSRNIVIHNNLHEGNVLLHFQEGYILPSVPLGNWGDLYAAEELSREDKLKRVDAKFLLNRDIRRLITLMGGCPPEFEQNQHLAWHLQRLHKEAIQLARRDKHLRITQYMANNFHSMPGNIIDKRQKDEPLDLR